MSRWGDRLAEPCEHQEPEEFPVWLHLLIWFAVIGIGWAASWLLAIFEPGF